MTNKQVLPKDVVSEQATTLSVLPTCMMSPDGDSDQMLSVTHNPDVTNGAGR